MNTDTRIRYTHHGVGCWEATDGTYTVWGTRRCTVREKILAARLDPAAYAVERARLDEETRQRQAWVAATPSAKALADKLRGEGDASETPKPLAK